MTLNHPLGRVTLAVAIGAVGGYVFALLNMPLPWMLGSMAACTIAALARAPISTPLRIRPFMIVVLGLMLGSGFKPGMLERAGEWLVSLSFLIFYIAVTAAVALPYFRKVARLDPVTAYFCAMPGGFNEMVMFGAEMGGDERKIALVHASRVLLVVFTVPFWFRITGDLAAIDRSSLGVGIADVPPVELLILATCGAIGWPLAKWLRIPAAALVGPTLLSAAAHIAGISHTQPPRELVNIAQLFIGTSVGCRFIGADRREVGGALAVGAGLTVIMLVVTALFALTVRAATETPFPMAALAFAPGGLAEMSLVGLALGADVAYIATHHIVRIFLVVTIAAPVFRLLRGAGGSGSP